MPVIVESIWGYTSPDIVTGRTTLLEEGAIGGDRIAAAEQRQFPDGLDSRSDPPAHWRAAAAPTGHTTWGKRKLAAARFAPSS